MDSVMKGLMGAMPPRILGARTAHRTGETLGADRDPHRHRNLIDCFLGRTLHPFTKSVHNFLGNLEEEEEDFA